MSDTLEYIDEVLVDEWEGFYSIWRHDHDHMSLDKGEIAKAIDAAIVNAEKKIKHHTKLRGLVQSYGVARIEFAVKTGADVERKRKDWVWVEKHTSKNGKLLSSVNRKTCGSYFISIVEDKDKGRDWVYKQYSDAQDKMNDTEKHIWLELKDMVL